MPRPKKITGNRCPYDQERDSCPMQCKYNHFENADGLVIDAWDLKCLDCGLRDTIAFRSDEMEEADACNPQQCPFCQQTNLTKGVNPCQSNSL